MGFRTGIFIFALTFFCTNSEAQTTWQEFKALARKNFANEGNLRIRSEQQTTYQNFDTPKWRKMLNQFGGKPVVSIKSSFKEELSLTKTMFVLSWEQTRTFANSVDDLDLEGFGDPFSNMSSVTQYITPQFILQKTPRMMKEENTSWSYKKNERKQLFLESHLENTCTILFGDLMQSDNYFLFLRSIAGGDFNRIQTTIHRDPNNDLLIDISYNGKNFLTRKYMADHPEKLLAEIQYKGNNKVFAFTHVDYDELKPISIVTYQFYGDPIDISKISNSDFMAKECNSITKTEIVEYSCSIDDDIFQVDFRETLKDGDVVTDHISGFYEVIGEEGSKRRIQSR